jgi:hypothetical protein
LAEHPATSGLLLTDIDGPIVSSLCGSRLAADNTGITYHMGVDGIRKSYPIDNLLDGGILVGGDNFAFSDMPAPTTGSQRPFTKSSRSGLGKSAR